MTVDDAARTVVVHRGGLRVAVNLAPDPVRLAMDRPIATLLLASGDARVEEDGVLTLPAESFAVGRTAEGTPARTAQP